MVVDATIIGDVLGMFIAPGLVPYAGVGIMLYVGKDIANSAVGLVKKFTEQPAPAAN